MNTNLFKALATCILAFSALSKAHCDLGDDEKQIADKFGDSLTQRNEKEYTVRTYHVPPYNVEVDFWNGKSAAQFYEKSDGAAISDSELQSLLASNSAGQKWIPNDNHDYGLKSWSLADEKADASYDFKAHRFFVVNPEFGPILRRIAL